MSHCTCHCGSLIHFTCFISFSLHHKSVRPGGYSHFTDEETEARDQQMELRLRLQALKPRQCLVHSASVPCFPSVEGLLFSCSARVMLSVREEEEETCDSRRRWCDLPRVTEPSQTVIRTLLQCVVQTRVTSNVLKCVGF